MDDLRRFGHCTDALDVDPVKTVQQLLAEGSITAEEAASVDVDD